MFKEEFCKKILCERPNAYRGSRRLLKYLENYFDYELIKSKPLKIIIHNIKKNYELLPDARQIKSQKKKDLIKDFIIENIETEKDNLFIFNCMDFAKIVKEKYSEKFKDLTIKTIAYKYIAEVLKEIADYETCWYFKGEYYTEEEYRKRQDEFFQEIYKKTENEDEFLEKAIYTLKNKEDFNIEERVDIYEKAISIFINEEGIILPVPRKRWRLKNGKIS